MEEKKKTIKTLGTEGGLGGGGGAVARGEVERVSRTCCWRFGRNFI